MSFSNVNIGNSAGDHAGDPLRTAFDKINKNFWKITSGNIEVTVNSPVSSVAGRTGDITLTVDDVSGAMSSGQVSAIVQSNLDVLSNYANLEYVNNLIPNVSTVSDMIDSAIDAENIQTIRDFQTYQQGEIYNNSVDINTLQTNAITLNQNIIDTNSALATANTAMKSYVDVRDASITSAWTANAATQAGLITALTANAATQAGQLASTANDITNLTTLVYQTPSQSAIDAANAAIVTANTALKSYTDTNFARLVNPVFPGNLTVVGNLYINGNTTTVSTNNVSVNDSIIYLANENPGNSLDIGFVGHFNNGTYQHTGLVRTAGNGQWNLFSNVIPEVGGTVNLTNAVYDPIAVGNITSPTITDLYANAAVQASAITTANTEMKAYVDAVTTAWTANAASQASTLATLTANAGAQSDAIAAKAPTASPTFTGNVGISGNIVFADGTYQNTAGGGGGTGLGSRTSISTTVTQLGYAIGNVNITGYKGYALYSISTSANATANIWVTVYSNIAARNADYGRDSITDPLPGTGVIAEVINVGNVTQYFTPAIYGFNNETTANTNVPLKVVVNNAGTFIANVTVTLLKLEN